MRALRIGICLLSMLSILMAGKIGEEMLGVALVSLANAKLEPEYLHSLSAFVYQNYRLNQNHFLLSLVPLAGILAAMPFLDRVVTHWDVRFFYALIIVWLVFVAYFGAFTYALMIPLTHVGLAADHEATIVTYAAAIACTVIVTVLIALYVRASRRAAN